MMRSFEEWRKAAERNAGRPLGEAEAQRQYRMTQLRQEGGNRTPLRGAYDKIESGQMAGFSSGHPMYDYARQHGMSEDFARFDPATLTVWEDAKDSSCPPGAPYRSYVDGSCVEKPIDSGGGAGGGPQMPAMGPTAPQMGTPGQAAGPNLAQILAQKNQISQDFPVQPQVPTPQVSGGLQSMMSGLQTQPKPQGSLLSGMMSNMQRKRPQNRGGWFSGGL